MAASIGRNTGASLGLPVAGRRLGRGVAPAHSPVARRAPGFAASKQFIAPNDTPALEYPCAGGSVRRAPSRRRQAQPQP